MTPLIPHQASGRGYVCIFDWARHFDPVFGTNFGAAASAAAAAAAASESASEDDGSVAETAASPAAGQVRASEVLMSQTLFYD